MLKTDIIDFTMNVNGLHCHEQDDTVDEASILVDRRIRYNSNCTN